MKICKSSWVGLSFFVSISVWAGNPLAVPPCLSDNRPIPVNNAEVLVYKKTTPNQTLKRAHILGTIQAIYPDHSGHRHFEISLGAQPDSMIEVIYNSEFGRIPDPKIGMTVEACGDYITSTAPAGQYPASPDGAIIHWVHKNPKPKGHHSGFLVMDGVLCGQTPGHDQENDQNEVNTL